MDSYDQLHVISDLHLGGQKGRQIFNLVKNEQPQTISFLLSYLDSAKSAEVFSLLPPEQREEVVEHARVLAGVRGAYVRVACGGRVTCRCARVTRSSRFATRARTAISMGAPVGPICSIPS